MCVTSPDVIQMNGIVIKMKNIPYNTTEQVNHSFTSLSNISGFTRYVMFVDLINWKC